MCWRMGKKFECPICGAAFSVKENLKRHKRLHVRIR